MINIIAQQIFHSCNQHFCLHVEMLLTIPWGCRAQAVSAVWPPLFLPDPPLPPAPPEGCGMPRTAATGEHFLGAEAPEDPRTDLCPWEEELGLPPLLLPPAAGTPLPSETYG